MPVGRLYNALGVYRGTAGLNEWQAWGIVRTIDVAFNHRTYNVRLDSSWPAHFPLWELLQFCNQFISDYAEIADGLRMERARGRFAFRTLVRNTWYRRVLTAYAEIRRIEVRRRAPDQAAPGAPAEPK